MKYNVGDLFVTNDVVPRLSTVIDAWCCSWGKLEIYKLQSSVSTETTAHVLTTGTCMYLELYCNVQLGIMKHYAVKKENI